MFVGLVLTFTFGAWLALAATAFLFAVAYGGRRRARTIIISVLVTGLLAGALALGPLRPVIEAKASGNGIGSLAWDAGTRLYGWKLALQLWWQHPFIGAGFGGFEFFSADYDFVRGNQSQGSTPHETYLYLLANTGLIGLLAVVAIFVGAIRDNLRLMRANPQVRVTAWAFAFALSVTLVGWFADDSVITGPHAGYLLWLLIGLGEVFARLVASGKYSDLPHA
jgi:O-antigen ligase